jgi:hypothetical protein
MNSRARRPIRMTRLVDKTLVKSCKLNRLLIGADWHDFTCSSAIKSIQSIAYACIRIIALNITHHLRLTGDKIAAWAVPVLDLGRVRAKNIRKCRDEKRSRS